MPHYKAIILLKAKNAESGDTIPIIIQVNNAIHAKAILQDQYGEGSVKEVKRNDTPPKYVRASR